MTNVLSKTGVAIILGAALVLAVVIVAVSEGLGDASVPDDAVVVVDTGVTVEAAGIEEGKISQEAFDRALDQAAKSQGLDQPPEPDAPRYQAIRDQAVGDLLDIAWIEAEAEERGITASEREIADQLEQTRSQSFGSEAEYQRFLEQSGLTVEEVELRVELLILSQKIQEQVANEADEPTTEDAEKFYEANKANYRQPEQRDVRVIVNRDEAKLNQALERLQADPSDENWNTVAAELSTDQSSKDNGGLRESVTPGVLPEAVDAAVFAAGEGTLEGPVNAPAGSYIYRVDSITPPSTQPFDQVAGQIQEQLSGQTEQEAFADFLSDYRDRWVSATICSDDFLIERCDNFVVVVPECTPELLAESGCPPPVISRAPAAPGTILPFAPPSGQPQQPHPAGGDEAAAPAIPGGFQNLPGAQGQGVTPGG